MNFQFSQNEFRDDKPTKTIRKISKQLSYRNEYNNCRKDNSILTCSVAMIGKKTVEYAHDTVGGGIMLSGLSMPPPVGIPTMAAGYGIREAGKITGDKIKNRIIDQARKYNQCREDHSVLTCSVATAADNLAVAGKMAHSMGDFVSRGKITSSQEIKKFGEDARQLTINIVDRFKDKKSTVKNSRPSTEPKFVSNSISISNSNLNSTSKSVSYTSIVSHSKSMSTPIPSHSKSSTTPTSFASKPTPFTPKPTPSFTPHYLGPEKGIKIVDSTVTLDDFKNSVYDIDNGYFLINNRIVNAYPHNKTYLREILNLYDQHIHSFSMSLENYRKKDNKIHTDAIFEPEIVGSTNIARVMIEADKILKEVLVTSSPELSSIDEILVKRFDIKLSMAGFFQLNESNFQIVYDRFIFIRSNIKLILHSYNNDKIPEPYNTKRNSRIDKFRKSIDFEYLKLIHGENLIQLEELEKALTLAKIIKNSNCTIVGNKRTAKIPNINNEVVEFPIRETGYIVIGGILIIESNFDYIKNDIGDMLRIYPLELEDEDEIKEFVRSLTPALSNNYFLILYFLNLCLVENKYFNRFTGKFEDTIEYQRRDMNNLINLLSTDADIFSIKNNNLATIIQDNFNVNSKILEWLQEEILKFT